MEHSREQPAAIPALPHAAALLHQAAQKIEQARLLLEGLAPADEERQWAAAEMMVERVNIRLRLAGKACARILLRLMAEPGQMVPVAELARVAGIRSGSSKVIKVYICRLRSAFVAAGITGAAIDTGSRSYGLRAGMRPVLSRLLAASDRPPESMV